MTFGLYLWITDRDATMLSDFVLNQSNLILKAICSNVSMKKGKIKYPLINYIHRNCHINNITSITHFSVKLWSFFKTKYLIASHVNITKDRKTNLNDQEFGELKSI